MAYALLALLTPAGAPAWPTPTGPLGIAPGYYVDAAVPCAQASDVFFYDGKRVGITNHDRNGSPNGLAIIPLGRVSYTPTGTMVIDRLSIELRKLPSNRIELTIQDTGPAMRLCGREEVPARFRAR